MTYVEKRLILRNGPPWGFRLYEDFMEGLIVAKIRHRSPSEQAGLREGDHVLAINGVDALDMSHAQAVQIIDFASYTLEIIVGRYERHKNTETVYMDNKALLSKQKPQEITTTELQLFWEKEMPLKPARRNWPPPPQPVQEYNIPPQQTPVQSKRPPLKQTHSVSIHVPAQKPVAIPTPPQIQTVHIPPPVRQQSIDPPIIPHDPDVTSVSVKQLMREFDVPPIAPELKSSFLHLYSKASPEELEYMAPPEAPPPPPPPPPSFPGLQPTKKPVIPSPPPMTFAPGQPKTVQEFLEKIKIFPKNLHTDLDPQKCFDIAAALYSSDSRGAKMFAKRHARAIKWDAQNTEDGDEPGNRMNVTVASGPGPTIRSHDQLKMVSKLPQSKTQQQLLMKQQQQQAPVNQSNNNSNNNNNNNGESDAYRKSSISLATNSSVTTPTPLDNLIGPTPKPFIPMSSNNNTPFGQMNNNSNITIGNNNNNGSNTIEANRLNNTSESGWRPVKFRIGQTAN
ncbi:hypothetical protein Smp_125480 [Schistosoma mansoni]|uniref:hypothetical protein n=1 Tax=Schistosoma mansoni TaxID=6183 RepID=UPI0001A6354A|nr:hypothetical protein Smp_125480 [Schistosoma mansoni]|eukprot:XP_018650515.1 hypothetical protein Smp_125480 [Schistosoma mansoni]